MYLLESRNENTALHFEACNPRCSPRRTPDGVLEIADIRGFSGTQMR
jgi:hypothetical protein